MRYSAILFDFDYTLADSSRGIVTCFQNVLNRHNYTGIPDETIKRTIGKTLEESFSILTGITDADQVEGLKKEYGKEADTYMTVNTILFPDVLSVLKELKNKGILLGIISTKYRFRIKEFLDKHLPPAFFNVIIGGEDVTHHKPDPEGLQKAISILKLNSEEVLYIGDSLIDAETADRAGVDFIGVLSGMTAKEEFEAFPYIRIIRNMVELLK